MNRSCIVSSLLFLIQSGDTILSVCSYGDNVTGTERYVRDDHKPSDLIVAYVVSASIRKVLKCLQLNAALQR